MNLRSAFWATLKLHGLVASRFAAEAGVADAQMSYWKNEVRDVNLRTLQKLLDAFSEEAYKDFLGYLGESSSVESSVEAAIALLETSDLTELQVSRLLAASSRCLRASIEEEPQKTSKKQPRKLKETLPTAV